MSENTDAAEYKVLPSAGLVMGFQYRGSLSALEQGKENGLASAGITGISDRYKLFRNTAGIGTILVYFTENGFAHFSACPAHELFNQSIALDNIFNKHKIAATEDRLALAATATQRMHIVEQFLLSQLQDVPLDPLITTAIKIIAESKGTVRIQTLHRQLCISPSPFEKRFRKQVGATPKKFSSIVRFNAVLQELNNTGSSTGACYNNQFFDQAHFIKNFKQFTGNTPEQFKSFL